MSDTTDEIKNPAEISGEQPTGQVLEFAPRTEPAKAPYMAASAAVMRAWVRASLWNGQRRGGCAPRRSVTAAS